MAIDNSRHVQRREVVEVLKMVLNEDKEMKENGGTGTGSSNPNEIQTTDFAKHIYNVDKLRKIRHYRNR